MLMFINKETQSCGQCSVAFLYLFLCMQTITRRWHQFGVGGGAQLCNELLCELLSISTANYVEGVMGYSPIF